MPAIIYIHGFLSSPLSIKAQSTQKWLAEHYPNVTYICPQLSSYPCEAKIQLHDVLAQYSGQDVYAIGSSLGGFWATYLCEAQYIKKAVLINPAVSPQTRLPEYIDQPVQSYYSEDVYTLSQKDMDDLTALDTDSIKGKDKYWVMLQTGDETLDYRQAVEMYAGCRQLVENGGNHSFEGYESWLPEIAAFLFD